MTASLKWISLQKLTCIALLLFTVGCGSNSQSDLQQQYGRRSGNAIGSVNGTWVLSEMFREAGYDVSSAKRLSPRVKRNDVIVWAPNSFLGPEKDTRDHLENWLTEQDGRTLIYIGREYDASIEYWDKMQSQATQSEKIDYLRQKALAQQRYDQSRNGMPVKEDYEWFTISRDHPVKPVKILKGSWAKGVDASKTELLNRSQFEFNENHETTQNPNKFSDDFVLTERLLRSGKSTLVARLEDDYWDSKIIVINNGSFLLNLPLVNSEHRKLAGKLIEECEYSNNVCFLETGQYVENVDSDNAAAGSSGWEWLTVWPINVSGFHFALLMIVLCFALFPYFGRPRKLPEESTSDFKKHIDSLGQLLEMTQDYDYAQLRIKQYQQTAKSETVYRRGRSKGN